MGHELLADHLGLFALTDAFDHKIRHVLVGQDIPDAVAGQQNKVPVVLDLAYHNVRTTRHHLLFSREGGVGFKGEIAQGTTQGQVAVDSIEFDKASGVHDPLVFFLVLRFVVHGQGHGLAIYTGDASTVAHIVDEHLVVPGEQTETNTRQTFQIIVCVRERDLLPHESCDGSGTGHVILK